MQKFKRIPSPISIGLILSYRCSAACKHCIYACSPKWNSDWISEDALHGIFQQLSGKLMPDTYGPNSTGLNAGLHFTGGEPFLNFDLLCKAVELAEKYKIPSTFVETNCFWAIDEKTTKEKLQTLKKKGLKGIMISVNPFYLEYVPFERTDRAIKISLDIFGRNVMVYQVEYYKRFKQWGFKGIVSLERYLSLESRENFLRNVEFFPTGRVPYKLRDLLKDFYPPQPPRYFFKERCLTPFLRNWHNHVDNYCNFIPGFCSGITFGDCRQLDRLLKEGIDINRFPILGFLMEDDLEGLYDFAKDKGFREDSEGYISKCHLCIELRKYLAFNYNFEELRPLEFYRQLV
ncbi:MAG: 4Fe-4S cluster-binding domain-containing protein [Thermodesulfovibrionales bacterium]|nr:4Fe-4S cluster-binding domain-containing protein [Thermodesulfovibrionales bacterium]